MYIWSERLKADTLNLAKRLRINILKMISRGGSSHTASNYSMVDIIAVLYGSIMKLDVTHPKCPDRDRFILSKGHAGACIYAALAEVGFFPVEDLMQHYQNGSRFSGHVSHMNIPGVELSTGSLGHGLSVAVGMALFAKREQKQHRIYALLSDGECDEGSNWEAFLFAPHHHLNNLIVIIDYNKIQSLATVESTLNLEPLAEKFVACHWQVEEVDGHDHAALLQALNVDISTRDKPTLIIAHTVKGKGVSFMEHSVLWHYRTPKGEEFERALAELEAQK